MASGRKRLLIGEISQGKTKGKALADELFRAMNQEEKTASYHKKH